MEIDARSKLHIIFFLVFNNNDSFIKIQPFSVAAKFSPHTDPKSTTFVIKF